MHRQIIEIDEEKCTGCGECLVACAERAIEIVEGKARLVSEVYCDGLGACLGKCPEGAIAIGEREAQAFDEEAVRDHLAALWAEGQAEILPGCPSAQVLEFGDRAIPGRAGPGGAEAAGFVLTHWPIKLKLVPPGAPFLRGADLILAADCTGFAWPGLHRELSANSAVLIGCSKFDDYRFALNRLTDILHSADVRSLTVVHMEVPCCAWHWQLAQEALAAAGRAIPLRRRVISVDGCLAEEERSYS